MLQHCWLYFNAVHVGVPFCAKEDSVPILQLDNVDEETCHHMNKIMKGLPLSIGRDDG